MRVISDKPYFYKEAAALISGDIKEQHSRLIGITGISCVGKSTFTRLLKEQLEPELTVQVIGVDSYLKKIYRGDKKFWTGTDSSDYLMPIHFNWEKLNCDVNKLKQGETIEKPHYVRGIGWDKKIIYSPADVLIVEGLFLDSEQAAVVMEYDKIISLSAEDDLIRRLRMDRDDYYRANFENFKRTKNETVRETESTLRAGKSYRKCLDKWNRIELAVQSGFKARIKEFRVE